MKITFKIIIFFLVLFGTASAENADVFKPIEIGPKECKQQIYHQPNGPFALNVFCEDALGSHIGIVYYKNMSQPIKDAWQITDRYWQLSEWGSDATSFCWDPSGNYLFISTSAIYGSGKVFVLDLYNRIATEIFPKNKSVLLADGGICLTNLKSVDFRNRIVQIEVTGCDKLRVLSTDVKY